MDRGGAAQDEASTRLDSGSLLPEDLNKIDDLNLEEK